MLICSKSSYMHVLFMIQLWMSVRPVRVAPARDVWTATIDSGASVLRGSQVVYAIKVEKHPV